MSLNHSSKQIKLKVRLQVVLRCTEVRSDLLMRVGQWIAAAMLLGNLSFTPLALKTLTSYSQAYKQNHIFL